MQFSSLPYPNLLHFILKMQIYNDTNQNSMNNMEIRLKMKEYILNSPGIFFIKHFIHYKITPWRNIKNFLEFKTCVKDLVFLTIKAK